MALTQALHAAGAQPLLRNPADRPLLCWAAVQGLLQLTAAGLAARHPGALLWLALAAGVSICHVLNTVAHVQLHTPLFRSRRHNAWFSLYLSASSGVPQALWRVRHFAHHAGVPPRRAALASMRKQLLCSAGFALALAAIGALAPLCYLLAIGCGLAIAQLQGIMEHAGGAARGVSHYGRSYNWLWFNDGYHCEHHAAPRVHWSELPRLGRAPDHETSALPPQLRWLAQPGAAYGPGVLCSLERLCLHWPPLARAVVRVHRDAFAALAPALGQPARISIVGGALFPRSVLALAPLFPDAALHVLDARAEHIAIARRYLAEHAPELAARVCWQQGFVTDLRTIEADLIVLPLACEGPLRRGARHPSARIAVHTLRSLPHASATRTVSRWLCKKLAIVAPG